MYKLTLLVLLSSAQTFAGFTGGFRILVALRSQQRHLSTSVSSAFLDAQVGRDAKQALDDFFTLYKTIVNKQPRFQHQHFDIFYLQSSEPRHGICQTANRDNIQLNADEKEILAPYAYNVTAAHKELVAAKDDLIDIWDGYVPAEHYIFDCRVAQHLFKRPYEVPSKNSLTALINHKKQVYHSFENDFKRISGFNHIILPNLTPQVNIFLEQRIPQLKREALQLIHDDTIVDDHSVWELYFVYGDYRNALVLPFLAAQHTRIKTPEEIAYEERYKLFSACKKSARDLIAQLGKKCFRLAGKPSGGGSIPIFIELVITGQLTINTSTLTQDEIDDFHVYYEQIERKKQELATYNDLAAGKFASYAIKEIDTIMGECEQALQVLDFALQIRS